jgi:hypothetical protein
MDPSPEDPSLESCEDCTTTPLPPPPPQAFLDEIQALPPPPALVTARSDVPREFRPNVLMYTVFGFFCILVTLWLVFSWTGYKDKYSQLTEGWHLGGTKLIEITLIREDKRNLGCASDLVIGGLHCGSRANGQPWNPNAEYDINTLQPFNTVKNELFLGAGLWLSPTLRGALPAERFTLACNYKVVGVARSIALRWSPTGSFSPLDQSAAVGTLTDCVIPQ